MSKSKQRLVVFASGRGSNFRAIAEACKKQSLNASVVALLVNKTDAGAIEYAHDYGIPVKIISSAQMSRKDHEALVLDYLDTLEHDYICLAGYMRILSKNFVQRFKKGKQSRIINIHPSLLPKYPGLNAYKRALEAKDPSTGVTVHYVCEGVDDGPIILQRKMAVHDNDTLENLEQRGLALEHKIYVEALDRVFQENSL